MAFPDAKRVIYDKNPLEEVICQLRFPPILKIDTESPSGFQERIRTDYPFYKAKPGLRLPAGIPGELASMIASELPHGHGLAAHEFTSRDEKWTLSLTREFLALTCRSYDRWENFKEHLRVPLDALQALYSPAFFTRIGLRYRDVLRRSTLGLEEAGWAELLQPWIAGALAIHEVAQDVDHSATELVLRLPDRHSRVRVHHGLAADDKGQEQSYVIDADFFHDQQTEAPHAIERLDFLNKQSRLFFRWCIQERLHEAMRPRPLSSD
jgi:uncharacterized protein (TIGR04255 family)